MKSRLSLSLQLAIVLFSLTTCTVLLLVLSERYGTRLDMTATRQHQLSEQSRLVLGKLERSVTVAVAADLTGLNKLTAQRLRDVLDTLSGSSPRISTRLMDTSSAAGQQAYEQLIRSMAVEDKAVIDDHLTALKVAAEETTDIASRLNTAGDELKRLGDELIRTMPVGGNADRLKAAWEANAADARLFSDRLTTAVSRSREILAKPLEPLPVPAADEALRVLREALVSTSSELPRINDTADQVVLSAAVPPEAKAVAREVSTRLSALRDRTARLASGLDKLGTLRVLKVASAIGRSRGCILIGAPLSGDPKSVLAGGTGALPPSLTAVDIDELLGPASGEAAGAGEVVDRRFRMEELLVAGLDAFVQRPRPLVVFVHADKGQLAPNFAPIRKLADRLSLLGIDVGEWRVVVDAGIPSTVQQALASGRPVIFATVSPALIPGEQAAMVEQATRVGKLSGAIELLLKGGHNLLVSVVPSPLPAGGAEDAMVKPLEALGIKADSGHVLMERVKSAAGIGVLTDAVLTDPLPPGSTAGGDAESQAAGLISQSVAGLKTRLIWPVTLLLQKVDGVTVRPVLALPASADRWAEAEWLRLRTFRGDPANAPSAEPGGPKDLAAPGDGNTSWVLAAAAERARTEGKGRQRIIVVGSQGWYADAITDAASVVDGRAVFEFPGNTELFVSSIRWLSNEEGLIRRSAQASSVPVIAGLSEGQLGAIRLLVIAVLPLGVLLLGGIWRIVRG